jgi:hypothetical protein
VPLRGGLVDRDQKPVLDPLGVVGVGDLLGGERVELAGLEDAAVV